MRIYKASIFALSFLLSLVFSQSLNAQATVTTNPGEKISTIRGVVVEAYPRASLF